MLTPGFQIKNRTDFPLQISLCQVGPLYYGIAKPGETFQRDTGAVWFTIKAAVFDGENKITDWDCVWPVAAIAGSVLLGMATGGASAFLSAGTVAVTAGVGTSIASGLVGAGMTATSALVVSGATLGAVSLGTATSILKTIFTPENCTVSKAGCYAGPPWPFREDVEPWSVEGGPTYRRVGSNIIGIGTDNLLYTRATLNSDWVQVPNSGLVKGVAIMKDGTILGVGMSGDLWTRATLTSGWVQVPNSGTVIGVTVMKDGTILGIGTDKLLWTRATLTSGWSQVPNSGSVIGVAVMKDGTILGIGTDMFLYTRATLTSGWVQVPNSGTVIGVTAMKDGTILGIGTDKYLWTRATLNSGWAQVFNSGSVIGVTEVPGVDGKPELIGQPLRLVRG